MLPFRRRLALWQILARAPEGAGLRALAERLGVSKNTVQRDIDELSVAGVPIVERQEGQRIVYALEQGPPAAGCLSRRDAVALAAARAALAPWGRTPMAADLEALRAKGARAGEVATFAGAAERGACPARPVLEALIEATQSVRRLAIRYQPRGAPAARDYTVEPYELLLHRGLVYLRARVQGHAALCNFVAHRIEAARVLGEAFRRRRAPRRHAFGVFEGRPEEVEAVFSASVAPYVAEKRWHPTQRLEARPDGTLRFRARVSGMHEFVGWIMSWGSEAELLRPVAWRQEVARRATGLLARHRGARASAA